MNTISPKQNTVIRPKRRIMQSNTSRKTSFKASVPSVNIITREEQKLFDIFSRNYGKISERVGAKLGKLASEKGILEKNSRFVIERGVSSIKPKSVGRSIVENAAFPITRLPLYAANWVLQKAKKVPGLKVGAEKLYSSSFFRVPRKLNELDEKTDIIKGMYDKTKEVVGKFAKEKGIRPEKLIDMLNKPDSAPEAKGLIEEANNYIRENLYKVSNKFFDKNTGNFNTAFERPLNRIVTGLVPVAFLANDAYNLSVLCGDTKDVSKKEAKERKKQEISRVFTTAYIQLITLGAFTKQVNTIPWFAPLTSAATVLFSEISSRKRLGKPIMFLSKDKAKEYNKKMAENPKNKAAKVSSKGLPSEQKQNTVTVQPQKINTINDRANKPKIFESFTTFAGDDKANKTEKKKEENKKALINFKTLKKGVGILLAAGFAISFIKNSSLTKDSKVVKGIQNFGKSIKKKFYDPLAFKNFEMPQSEFESITKSLKDAGCKEIAEGHEYVKEKYTKTVGDGIIKVMKSSLPSDKKLEVISAVKGGLGDIPQAEEVAKSLATAIKLEGTSIAENKFDRVALKTQEILKNKGVNLEESQLTQLSRTIEDAISSRIKETPITVDKKLKPFVDIVTEPFKFLYSAARLPFKIVSTAIRLIESPIEKKIAQAEIGKLPDGKKITSFEKAVHKVVTEVLGERKQKSGKTIQNVFVNTMDQMQRKTQPYRAAAEKYSQLIAQHAPQGEIEAAREAMQKAKGKLGRYVNTAVEKSFNGVTQSNNKNTDLAMMTKLASSTVTSAFLVADNYNMVMLKSDGEDKEGAKEKANERIIQRLSALFYQTMFINWFNSTFRSIYNSSLKGMAAVALPNTLTTEIVTRKSIGMPVGRKTYEQLVENEEKNENRKGFLGKYFKFMRLLTGKKPLKDRMPKDKSVETKPQTVVNTNKNNETTTNLLKKYAK